LKNKRADYTSPEEQAQQMACAFARMTRGCRRTIRHVARQSISNCLEYEL